MAIQQTNSTQQQAKILGLTTGLSSFSTSSTSDVQMTGATVTVTIPAGGRKVRVSLDNLVCNINTANLYVSVCLWEGTVGTGTALARKYCIVPNVGGFEGISLTAVYAPSAGSKTYNVGVQVQGGTGGVNVYTGGYLMVEDMGI